MLNTLWFSVICGQTYAYVPAALIQHLVRRLAIHSKIDKMGEGVIFKLRSLYRLLSVCQLFRRSCFFTYVTSRKYRCMYHRIPHNFLSFIFYVTSIYHGLLLVFWKGFPCSFSSCVVLRLDLAYSSIFEAWHYLDKILMYHRTPVWQ